jgi:hypothetical protein
MDLDSIPVRDTDRDAAADIQASIKLIHAQVCADIAQQSDLPG